MNGLIFLMQTKYPILLRLHETYNEHPAFRSAMPENQPDTPSS